MEDWALIRRLAAEGTPKAAIARRLGIARNTVAKAVDSSGPPKYERKPGPTSVAPYEVRVRALLADTPDMPAAGAGGRFGEARPLRRATFSYRLPGVNGSDQRPVHLRAYARPSGHVGRVRHGMELRRKQARALIDHLGSRLPDPARRRALRFVAAEGQGPVGRHLALLRGGHLHPDVPRNLATLLWPQGHSCSARAW